MRVGEGKKAKALEGYEAEPWMAEGGKGEIHLIVVRMLRCSLQFFLKKSFQCDITIWFNGVVV